MILMALLIGAVTGDSVVFIRYLIKELTALSFGGGVDVLSNIIIRKLDIGANFNVDILVIKSTTKDGPKYKASPDPSYKFQKADAIVFQVK